MNLDERIREALRANSQWPGSPDELWQRISSQLQPKPKRSRQPLWLGTAAAAVLVLVFVFQAVWNPQPPPLPEAEEAVPMRMLTAVLPPSGPQLVQPGKWWNSLWMPTFRARAHRPLPGWKSGRRAMRKKCS